MVKAFILRYLRLIG